MASSLFSNQPAQNQNGLQNNNLQQFQNFMALSKGMNPNAIMQILMNNNPHVSGIMNIVNTKYGGDPKAAFYDIAKQKGVDPNQIIGMLRRT